MALGVYLEAQTSCSPGKRSHFSVSASPQVSMSRLFLTWLLVPASGSLMVRSPPFGALKEDLAPGGHAVCLCVSSGHHPSGVGQTASVAPLEGPGNLACGSLGKGAPSPRGSSVTLTCQLWTPVTQVLQQGLIAGKRPALPLCGGTKKADSWLAQGSPFWFLTQPISRPWLGSGLDHCQSGCGGCWAGSWVVPRCCYPVVGQSSLGRPPSFWVKPQPGGGFLTHLRQVQQVQAKSSLEQSTHKDGEQGSCRDKVNSPVGVGWVVLKREFKQGVEYS